MLQTPTSLDSTLLTAVLAILAVGLPILLVLAVRFFWDRSLHLGRSKELEKLIWQLHRIASAMEHQMNLTYPSVQPGTEELKDLAYLQRPAAPAAPAQPVVAPRASTPVTAKTPVPPAVAPPANEAPASQQQPAAAAQPPEAEPSGFPPLEPRDPNQPPRHGGVNSMFGF